MNKKQLDKLFHDKGVNQLPYYLSKTESKIYRLVEHKESGKGLRRIKYARNYLRKLLLLKLIRWYDEKGLSDKPETSYAEIIEEKELKKLRDDVSTKKKFMDLLDEIGGEDETKDIEGQEGILHSV